MMESGLMRTIWMGLAAAADSLLFRNNVAQAIVGHVTWIKRMQRVAVGPGDCVVRGARVLHAGLVVGSGDLIGGTPVLITPEHVGMTLLVFTSVEVKTDEGRSTKEQRDFRDLVNREGGIAGIVRTLDEALALVRRLVR